MSEVRFSGIAQMANRPRRSVPRVDYRRQEIIGDDADSSEEEGSDVEKLEDDLRNEDPDIVLSSSEVERKIVIEN